VISGIQKALSLFVVAVLLGFCILTGIAYLGSQAALAEAQREAAELGDSLARAEDRLADSQAALGRAIERGQTVERIVGELGGVIGDLTGGTQAIDDLIGELIREVGDIISILPD
jgi:hypothetical protein